MLGVKIAITIIKYENLTNYLTYLTVPLPDGDADSGVDESTQAQETVEQPEPKRMMSSRIPRKTPPDSPMKRARSSNPPETRRMPR